MAKIHIPHQGEDSGLEVGSKDLATHSRTFQSSKMGVEEKVSSFESIKNVFGKVFLVLKFLSVTSVIFLFTLSILNFSAYKQIALDFIYPEDVKEKEIALENSVNDEKKEQNLLQVNKKRKAIKKNFPPIDLKITPPTNRLVIPKIGKNIPIVQVDIDSNNLEQELIGIEVEGAIQDALRNGVVHYPGTAAPGQHGNFFVTGHSSYYPWDSGEYKEVFALLSKLEVGDIYVAYYDQKKYTYKVTVKKEVSPTQVDVLTQPKDKRVSTLMTCTPLGTALRRLIIQAELIEEEGRQIAMVK